ncbi:MetQ/NlpA family ABC transporter substrate-binding protein [Anaerobiospirillum sp. NML120448]|uniref:MetQ/NlpA family ABC transporter substrate-binding protein n=1 Tax=Anaerobiospirillum sp. NML120448 TaxID=2932816 RepID=UPI001FF3CD4B|nr:MetQ/NlpA family ABC transporter substrate-binding protein [Anaerobiospirillum sp. NML120448]MCK0513904.1 MetQ/NlpA family ABC transporter substrate-binding protein [Anaerobiospirillum sp. NML120448]
MSKLFLNIYGTFHGRNHSNTSVQCVTKYEVNYDSNGNYNIGSIVSKEELNSATKLSDPTDVTVTVLDVTENPKNLKFQELEAAQLPRALPDVDFAVINTNYAIPAGLNPLKDALFIEDADSPYVNILVANSKSAKNPDLKVLIDELSSEETAKFITEKYNGAVVPVATKAK